MRFIGDIHGDLSAYETIIGDCTESVQVGDFGMGFCNTLHVEQLQKGTNHRFIRGNHDNPQMCQNSPNFIPDGTVDTEKSIAYLGGAWSIDFATRTPGYDWWPDEEVNQRDLDLFVEKISEEKPRIIVSHDCPTSVAYTLFIANTNKNQYITRTAEALEQIFKNHTPDFWIFGHWHMYRAEKINGTRFICLDINQYIDIKDV